MSASGVAVICPSASTRPSLTANRSAKSQPTAMRRVVASGRWPRLRTRRSSRIPSPTYRRRSTSTSVRDARGRARARNVARKGPWRSTVSGCSGPSSRRRRQSDRIRVSRKKSPSGPSPRRSPDGGPTQKVEPSTRVTVWPEEVAGSVSGSGPSTPSGVPSPAVMAAPVLLGRETDRTPRRAIGAPARRVHPRPRTIIHRRRERPEWRVRVAAGGIGAGPPGP